MSYQRSKEEVSLMFAMICTRLVISQVEGVVNQYMAILAESIGKMWRLFCNTLEKLWMLHYVMED